MGQTSLEVAVDIPPPELPVYDQPPIPGNGYIWTPGYWAWSEDIQDYYWVPGTWILAPQPGYLWTPGYWGLVGAGAVFLWHPGYWGPRVGFYGGVNYGYGYGGRGYEGGYWRDNEFYYNRWVNNMSNVHITNVYNRAVVNNANVGRLSYNGANGIHAQPTAAEVAAAEDRHLAVTAAQQQHDRAARGNSSLRATENRGFPPIAATPRPGALTGGGVVGARHAGTLSVVHSPAPPPPPPGNLQQQQQQQSIRAAPLRRAPPEGQPRGNQPPPMAPRRTPEQMQMQPPPRPNAPLAHPNVPRPVQRTPEPEVERERH